MANVSKLLETKNPLTANSQSLTDPKGLLQMVLWVVMFLAIVATGQNVARAVSGKFSRLDTSPEPVFRNPTIGNSETIL